MEEEQRIIEEINRMLISAKRETLVTIFWFVKRVTG